MIHDKSSCAISMPAITGGLALLLSFSTGAAGQQQDGAAETRRAGPEIPAMTCRRGETVL